MVRLLEFEIKEILKRSGLPIPKQFELTDLTNQSIYPIVIKSQVPIGGRGKLGGIRFAKNEVEAKSAITQLKSLKIEGYLPESLLIEEKLSVLKEYYCGFVVNRDKKNITFIFSEAGGVNIEVVSKESKDQIYIQEFTSVPENPDELIETFLKDLLISNQLKSKLKLLLHEFLKIILSYDAELFELNPLIETTSHELIIADARMNIDDNALFRHKEYQKNLKFYLKPLELKARELNMSYVELDGTIGVICNGAGLVMGTIDTIQSYGVKAANFLDVGGGADAERMYQALQIISTNPDLQGILINIIGGITRCDEIARGLIRYLEENQSIKFSLRLIGTNEKAGQELLAPFKIIIHHELEDAMKALIPSLTKLILKKKS